MPFIGLISNRAILNLRSAGPNFVYVTTISYSLFHCKVYFSRKQYFCCKWSHVRSRQPFIIMVNTSVSMYHIYAKFELIHWNHSFPHVLPYCLCRRNRIRPLPPPFSQSLGLIETNLMLVYVNHRPTCSVVDEIGVRRCAGNIIRSREGCHLLAISALKKGVVHINNDWNVIIKKLYAC